MAAVGINDVKPWDSATKQTHKDTGFLPSIYTIFISA
jgi:hypothetical protein